MPYFTKRYHPPGTPPGTLIEDATLTTRPLTLRLVDYSATAWTERDHASFTECQPYLARSDTITWIHVQGYAPPDLLRELGAAFGLHPLALEDVHNTGQRPKLDSGDHQLFVITTLPVFLGEEIGMEQVSLFLGENYLISFHNGANEPFAPIRERLRKTGGSIRSRGADYLFYALLDLCIDQGFPILEQIGDWIAEVEEELLEAPSKELLGEIHQLKRDLLLLRRMLWPQREVLNQLIREEHGLVHEQTKPYLRDCYDHTVQIMDLLETYRDMTASMMDVYLSSISNRLGDVMRVLTVIATLFIPPTFLVGIYGMNFAHPDSPWAMPELHWYYGYPLVWLLIAVMIGSMLVYFKRKNWF